MNEICCRQLLRFAWNGRRTVIVVESPAGWPAGRVDEARFGYERMLAIERPIERPFSPLSRLPLRAMHEVSDGRHEAAEETLAEAIRMQARCPLTYIVSDACVLHVYLALTRSRTQAAVRARELGITPHS